MFKHCHNITIKMQNLVNQIKTPLAAFIFAFWPQNWIQPASHMKNCPLCLSFALNNLWTFYSSTLLKKKKNLDWVSLLESLNMSSPGICYFLAQSGFPRTTKLHSCPGPWSEPSFKCQPVSTCHSWTTRGNSHFFTQSRFPFTPQALSQASFRKT